VNRGQMAARVSERLAEGGAPTFYPASKIIDGLNEGYGFFVFLTLAIERTAPWVVAPNTTFHHLLPVFPDWIVPLRIATASGARVRFSFLADLAARDSQWLVSPGYQVSRYTFQGSDLIGVYQQPTAPQTLTVTYAAGPAPLTDDASVPEIPVEYHPALVAYAIYYLRQVEGAQEFGKALKYFQEFLEAAGKHGAYVRSRNLGCKYDTVPFELASFDHSHLLKLRPDLADRKVAQ